MKIRGSVLGFLATIGLAGGAVCAAQTAQTAQAPKSTAGGIEARLPGYLNIFLPFDPQSKVTVEKAPDKIPGFQSFKIKRTGKYAKLAVDRTVNVSDDGKWYFDGDAMVNQTPAPVRSAADLGWLEAKVSNLYHARVKAILTPEKDAAGYKGVAMAIETGYGAVRIPGFVSPDGSRYLGGVLWDFTMDPREDRKKRIDLSTPRFQGKPDAAITIVEYADMECPYCRFRGLQMDALLDANPKLSYKRYYKFFVLWFNHAWAMKAASAADCLFRFAGQAMFGFKKHVYAQQDVMTVSSIDELALTEAEAAGVPKQDFLNCYLRDESLADVRKDIEEGQRLAVKSTPTYFIDGTEITWIEDTVMEDFLRTKDPSLKTVNYGPKP
ncbi:MAG TPA: thioredoxin domain-containing protein [Thermoanaerobaculia bacterium]|jgi:protein-disulfide isomerase